MRGKSVLVGAVLLLGSFPATARQPQQTSSPPQTAPQPQGRGQRGAPVPMDPERAQRLYVSNNPSDHSKPNYQAQIEAKARTDTRFAEACEGVIDFKQVKYRSSVGDLDIPAYVFQPLQKRGPKGTVIWENRRKPLSGPALHRWWYRCLARAGVVDEGTTHGKKMHGARYTSGTEFYLATGDIYATQQLLGHADVSTTANIYVQGSPADLEAKLRKVWGE